MIARSHAPRDTIHGPAATAQLATIAAVQAACPSRGHVEEAVEGLDEPVEAITDREADRLADRYYADIERQMQP